MAMLAGEDFGNGYAFIFGLVGEHRSAHNVANGVDAVDIGLEMIVDDNAAAIQRNAGFFKPQAVGIWTTPGRHEHDIGFQYLWIAAGNRLESYASALLCLCNGGDFRGQVKFHALLFEDSLGLFGDFAIHARQDAVEIFHHDDFRAQPPPDRTHLEPDYARTDDDQLAWSLFQFQRAR